jgi:hypothetical protein
MKTVAVSYKGFILKPSAPVEVDPILLGSPGMSGLAFTYIWYIYGQYVGTGMDNRVYINSVDRDALLKDMKVFAPGLSVGQLG